jgi:hypothetical protein
LAISLASTPRRGSIQSTHDTRSCARDRGCAYVWPRLPRVPLAEAAPSFLKANRGPVGKARDQFQLGAHRPEDATQGREVHVAPGLELRDRVLSDLKPPGDLVWVLPMALRRSWSDISSTMSSAARASIFARSVSGREAMSSLSVRGISTSISLRFPALFQSGMMGVEPPVSDSKSVGRTLARFSRSCRRQPAGSPSAQDRKQRRCAKHRPLRQSAALSYSHASNR